MANPFFTVGHSTRPISEFVELLRQADAQFVVDVRTIPRSRANPQFNSDRLRLSLSESSIGYEHIAELGGLRPLNPNVFRSMNAFWKNSSFHNYADYAMSDSFQTGLRRLRQLGHAKRTAIMCAEAVWWRCHRRIISDYLLSAGDQVFHILGRDRIERATLTPEAVVGSAGTLTYPADSQRAS
jgi:uncharacterized protein (DUF488 family)